MRDLSTSLKHSNTVECHIGFNLLGSRCIRILDGLILLSTIALTLAAGIVGKAQELIRVGQDSSLPNGLFCYRSGRGEDVRIHLVRLGGDKIETVFTKSMPKGAPPPVLLSEAVIVVSVDGVVHKLDLNGEFVFRMKPAGVEGVSGLSGKVNNKHIFMTETVYDKRKQGPVHYLCIVDVSGKEPIVKRKFRMVEFGKVTRTSDDIVIIGRKKVQRLKIAKVLGE